ncbi:sensor histidine kinase [Paenibacillus sp. 2TAB23]
MKKNPTYTWAAASLAIALLTALLARMLLAFMLQVPPYNKPLKWVIEHVGSLPIMLAVAVLIFGVCYIKLFKQKLAWFQGGASKAALNPPTSHPLFRTIRWTFMAAFLQSLVLMIFFVIAGHLLAYSLIQYTSYDRILIWMVNHMGSTPIAAMFGCLLFLAFFFWTSRKMIADLKDIRNGLKQMAAGRLDYSIPVKSSDELGEIATSINELGQQFNQLLQEERNAERSKNDLITGVSHDLRTPLTSILGYLELIEHDRYQDEVELRYFVTIAYEKSKHLKGLIDDLFEYTKLNNDMPLALIELDIARFAAQLAEEFVPSLEKADMSCRIQASAQRLVIMADGDLLARAFDNLMANAIQYGHKGKFIDIQITRTDEEAIVRFINYGDPIPPKDIAYIFDRFYRADRSRTAEMGGTGLGLAITRSIVEAHSGLISVSSTPAETCFETRFPIAKLVT